MTKNIYRYYSIVTPIFMSTPSNVPSAPSENPTGASAIPAIGTAVHAAVPWVSPHDACPEILEEAIIDLFNNPDLVWSTDQSSACNTGKANFLRITSSGYILLDVIKPWVRFSTGVHLDAGVDLEAIKENIRQCDWIRPEPEGFLPPWIKNNIERLNRGVGFDPDGSSRPGASFVFDRIRVLQESTTVDLGFMLRWIGRHTNPAKGEKHFRVDDTLRLEGF